MGRRKRHDFAAQAAKDDAQPFCYYCDREFEDEGVLIQHQKSKHFKCSSCGKKMTTIGSLITHHRHVHKEGISKVPNAKEGRDSLEVQIYGMEGMPLEVLTGHRSAKRQKRAAEFGEDEDDRGMMGGFAGPIGFVAAVPAPIPMAAAQLSPEMLAVLASAMPFQAQAMAAASAMPSSLGAAGAGSAPAPDASAAAPAAPAPAAPAPAPAAAPAPVAVPEKEVMGGTLVYDDESLSIEESRLMRSARYLQYLHYL